MRLAKPKLVSTIFAFSIIFSISLFGCQGYFLVPSDAPPIRSLVKLHSDIKTSEPEIGGIPELTLNLQVSGGKTHNPPYILLANVIPISAAELAPESIGNTEYVRTTYSKIYDIYQEKLPSCNATCVVGVPSGSSQVPILSAFVFSKSSKQTLEIQIGKLEGEEKDLSMLDLKQRFRETVADIE